MVELKRRVAVFDSAVLPFRIDGVVSIPSLELACPQLRKCYELIGFAAISANRERYATIRRGFERDWNLPSILAKIEAINPTFLPQGVETSFSNDGQREPHALKGNGRSMTKQELLSNHGRLGSMMHAANPYSKRIEYMDWYNWICERRDELVLLLSNHVANVEYQRTFYLCAMDAAPNSEVQVTIFNIQGLRK